MINTIRHTSRKKQRSQCRQPPDKGRHRVVCRQIDEHPDPDQIALCGFHAEQLTGATLYKAVGCSHCNNTGYRGRLGIFEMLEMNTELRKFPAATKKVVILDSCHSGGLDGISAISGTWLLAACR